MTDESTKRRILARRAHLVAAALSAVACSPPETRPSVCLEPIILPPEDSGATTSSTGDVAPPQPCLQPVPPDPPDAGPADSGTAKDAGVKDSGVKPPPPQVCLSPMPPKPTVCLKPMQPPPNVCLYIMKK